MPWMNDADDDPNSTAVEQRRLAWRSRRGMLELDLLLMPFVERVFPGLDAADRERYRALLEEDDPVLFEWFNGRSLPEDDPPLLRLIQRIRAGA